MCARPWHTCRARVREEFPQEPQAQLAPWGRKKALRVFKSPSEAKPLGKVWESPGRISSAGGKGGPVPAALLSPHQPAFPRFARPCPGIRRARRVEVGALGMLTRPEWRWELWEWERALLAGISARLSSFRGRVNCRSREEETYSLLTIFNLKMQMLLVSRSVIRVPLCQALTSIRGD